MVAPYVKPDEKIAAVGAVAALPSTGTYVFEADYDPRTGHGWIRATLTSAVFNTTDAAASGSYAVLKLFDFNAGRVTPTMTRMTLTSFASSTAVTGGANDLSGLIGIGSVALAAAQDAALANATDDNFITGVAIDESGFTSLTAEDSVLGVIDGTSTAADLVINLAGEADDSDADGTVTITGVVYCAFHFEAASS